MKDYPTLFPDSDSVAGVDAQTRVVGIRADIHGEPQEIVYGEPICCRRSSPVDYDDSFLSINTIHNADPDQIHDGKRVLVRHAITSELNRWVIGDNSFCAYDMIWDGYDESEDWPEVSLETNFESDDTGLIPSQYYSWNNGVCLGYCFSKLRTIPGIRIDFPNNDVDGYGVDFMIVVHYGSLRSDTQYIFQNRSPYRMVMSLWEERPTGVSISVSKWSLPSRRVRIPEISLGYYDTWYEDKLQSISIQRKTSFAPFSLPYSTCTLTFDNSDKLFDPTNKAGLFKSIEDKQEINISMLTIEPWLQYSDSDGTSRWFYGYDHNLIATFYQYDSGWKTGNSELTMKWNLVDIIGLLSDRSFDSTKLPIVERGPQEVEYVVIRTVSEWVEAVLSQLGKKFTSKYQLSDRLKSLSLPELRLAQIQDVTCTDILLWISQATRTWIKVMPNGDISFQDLDYDDPGHSVIIYRGPYGDVETCMDLTYDNMTKYPVLQANDNIASIEFKIPKKDRTGKPVIGTERSYTINNSDVTSTNTETVSNPFLLTEQEAHDMANYTFDFYGGNQIETVGRGNPWMDLGDLQYVEISKGAYLLGRITEQSFEISDHIMKNCKTKLIVENPLNRYDTFVVLTLADVNDLVTDNLVHWTVPDNLELDVNGVGLLKIVLVQAGQTGGHAKPTIWNPNEYQGEDEEPGEWEIGLAGEHGLGGYINVVDEEPTTRGANFDFYIGKSAEPRSTFRADPMTGKIYFDDNNDIKEGGHTEMHVNGSLAATSADGERYADGYIEPLSGKGLGKPGVGAPRPDSGDGGYGGGSAFTFLEDRETGETLRPEDLNDRTAFAGSLGVRGANGCVVICYRAGLDNTIEEN